MHRNLKLLAAFHFFTDLDLFAPVGIIYLSKVTGSYALGMSVIAWMMIFAALFEIPTGIYSDMIGRKNTMIASAVTGILSAVSLAAGTAYIFLFSSSLFAGLSRAFQEGNNEAYIYETLHGEGKEHLYHHYLGKLSSVFQFALIFAAIGGSILASKSFTLLIWIAILPKVCMLIISFFFTEPSFHSNKSANIFAHLGNSFRTFYRDRKLTYLGLAMSIQFAIGESAYTFRTIFVQALWPLWAVGISNALSNIGAGLSYFYSGKILDRFRAKPVLVFEVIFNRIINLFALFVPTPASPAIMGLTSVTYGVGDVARKHLSQLAFGEHERATMASVIALMESILFAGVSLSMGALADHIGPVKTLIAAHIALLVPLWFYNQIFQKDTNV